MVLTSLRHPESRESDEEKYPALRIVLLIWKVLAVVQVLAVISVGILAVVTVKKGEPNQIAIGLLIMLGGSLAALIQWASAEFVQVVMDIEENTRRAAER